MFKKNGYIYRRVPGVIYSVASHMDLLISDLFTDHIHN